MAYSKNILPKAGAYYSLNGASIVGSELRIETNGYAEINISKQMLAALTSKMLVVVHPSVFSDHYASTAVKVELDILTEDGERLTFLIPASEQRSGVFNTEIELLQGSYSSFTYRISSIIPVTIYNWELCSELSEDMSTVIDGVEQALPRLLYDYNTYSYAVAQSELTVGLISCYLQSATDLQGHFTLSFFATERCNVHVRIKDNGVTELFTPQVYTVEKGYASISIPHAYLKKSSDIHAFSVTIQCTNGQLSIPVRGLLYTIDGGYLATRLLDAGIDIVDLTIKQTPIDVSPSEIYAVGFESKRLILKSRVYNAALSADWSTIKDFGECLDAAVEFRGDWLLRGKAGKYTMETDDYPYVFLVDNTGNLKAYSDSLFETEELLDVGVTAVSACQGFNSMFYEDQDQGLIVAYIKSGNVAYRRRVYDTSTGSYRWDSAYGLYGLGDALHVNVHRLPDYRVGICVEHSSGTKWYITDRTYVGQSIKPEFADSIIDCGFVATVMDLGREPEETLWSATLNEFSSDNKYHNGFIMTFDGALHFVREYGMSTLLDSIIIKVNNVEISKESVRSIDLYDGTVRVYLQQDVVGGSTVSVSFNCPYLLLRIYNGCLAKIKQDYSWSLPLPTTYLSASENASANIGGAPDVTVRQIVTTSIRHAEEAVSEVDATLDAVVRPIIASTLSAEEFTASNVSGSVDITVSQVGVTPI